MSARADLCGGRPAIVVSIATSSLPPRVQFLEELRSDGLNALNAGLNSREPTVLNPELVSRSDGSCGGRFRIIRRQCTASAEFAHSGLLPSPIGASRSYSVDRPAILPSPVSDFPRSKDRAKTSCCFPKGTVSLFLLET